MCLKAKPTLFQINNIKTILNILKAKPTLICDQHEGLAYAYCVPLVPRLTLLGHFEGLAHANIILCGLSVGQTHNFL